MKKSILKNNQDLFKSFLGPEVYEKWSNNRKEYIKPNTYFNFDKVFTFSKSEFISTAFSWKNTPEGPTYWFELDREWMEFIKNPTKLAKLLRGIHND
jgi:hypothetical protein